jgi:hypothetical protein
MIVNKGIPTFCLTGIKYTFLFMPVQFHSTEMLYILTNACFESGDRIFNKE